jgi:aspartate 1-decarboxylase
MSFAVVDESEAAAWVPRIAILAESNRKVVKVTPSAR